MHRYKNLEAIFIVIYSGKCGIQVTEICIFNLKPE